MGKIYEKACSLLDQGSDLTAAACMAELDEAEVRQLTKILSDPIQPEKTKSALSGLIEEIRIEHEKHDASEDEGIRAMKLIQRKRG